MPGHGKQKRMAESPEDGRDYAGMQQDILTEEFWRKREQTVSCRTNNRQYTRGRGQRCHERKENPDLIDQVSVVCLNSAGRRKSGLKDRWEK